MELAPWDGMESGEWMMTRGFPRSVTTSGSPVARTSFSNPRHPALNFETWSVFIFMPAEINLVN